MRREKPGQVYSTPAMKAKVSKKSRLLKWCNVVAGLAHLVSFTAAIVVVVVLDQRTPTLVSTDFVRAVDVGGTDVLAVDSRVHMESFVTWLVVSVPLITSMFHLVIGCVLPYAVYDYAKLSSSKIEAGAYIYRVFTKYSATRVAPEMVSLFSKPKNVFDYYTNVIALGINPLRWIEYAISSSLMIVAIAALSGVSNVFILVFLAVPLNVALMIIGGNYFEQDNIGYQRPLVKPSRLRKVRWKFFFWGVLFFLAQWAVIFSYFFAAVTSTSQVPVFVYLVVFVMFSLFSLFAVNPVLHYLGAFSWISDFVNYELVFIALSFIAKLALDWILIIGVSVTPRDIEFSSL